MNKETVSWLHGVYALTNASHQLSKAGLTHVHLLSPRGLWDSISNVPSAYGDYSTLGLSVLLVHVT